MKDKPNNPQAFPSGESYTTTDYRGMKTQNAKAPLYQGMTLRDYFAAKAMQGLITSPEQYSVVKDPESCAKEAYKIADAMLKEREI